jgi:hypothetical protein
MKKLIVMDPVQICGSDLTSGTLDEKRECMGYDTMSDYQIKSGHNESTVRRVRKVNIVQGGHLATAQP